jgi:hypothetical protein
MGISRYGKRYEEKLASAEAAAEAEEERLRNLTPADQVSEVVANIELLDRTGVALAKALRVALLDEERSKQAITSIPTSPNGWMESKSTGVRTWAKLTDFTAEYVMEPNWYYVGIGGPVTGHRHYVVPDEVLNHHSRTSVTFQTWVMKVARALYVTLQARELVHSDNTTPIPEVTREALEQLEDAGVQLATANRQRISTQDVYDEADAIESIKKALGQ